MAQRIAIVIGVALMVAGVFLPMVNNIGSQGDLNFFDFDKENDTAGDGNGSSLLVIALVIVVMLVFNRADAAWIPGLMAFWIVLFNFYSVYTVVHRSEGEVDLKIGWLLMFGGSTLIILASRVEQYFHGPEAPREELLADETPSEPAIDAA